MSADQEDELRAIWQSHLTTARPFSAEQLQARALLLEPALGRVEDRRFVGRVGGPPQQRPMDTVVD